MVVSACLVYIKHSEQAEYMQLHSHSQANPAVTRATGSTGAASEQTTVVQLVKHQTEAMQHLEVRKHYPRGRGAEQIRRRITKGGLLAAKKTESLPRSDSRCAQQLKDRKKRGIHCPEREWPQPYLKVPVIGSDEPSGNVALLLVGSLKGKVGVVFNESSLGWQAWEIM
jgi:hypothetical protein